MPLLKPPSSVPQVGHSQANGLQVALNGTANTLVRTLSFLHHLPSTDDKYLVIIESLYAKPALLVTTYIKRGIFTFRFLDDIIFQSLLQLVPPPPYQAPLPLSVPQRWKPCLAQLQVALNEVSLFTP